MKRQALVVLVFMVLALSAPAMFGEEDETGWSVDVEPWVVDKAEVLISVDGTPVKPRGIGVLLMKPEGRAADLLVEHGVEFRDSPRSYTSLAVIYDEQSRPVVRTGGPSFFLDSGPAKPDDGYFLDCHTEIIGESSEIHLTVYYMREGVCLNFDVVVIVDLPDSPPVDPNALSPEQLMQSQVRWTYQGECEWPEPQEHGE